MFSFGGGVKDLCISGDEQFVFQSDSRRDCSCSEMQESREWLCDSLCWWAMDRKFSKMRRPLSVHIDYKRASEI